MELPNDFGDLATLPDNAWLVVSIVQLKGNKAEAEIFNPDSLTIDIYHV